MEESQSTTALAGWQQLMQQPEAINFAIFMAFVIIAIFAVYRLARDPARHQPPRPVAKPKPKAAPAPVAKAEPKKVEAKKPAPKPEPKKAEPKKAEPKKVAEKKPEPKKVAEKKPEPKKAEPKKVAEKKPEPKKAELKKVAEKKPEPKAASKPEAKKPEAKPEPKKPEAEPKAETAPKAEPAEPQMVAELKQDTKSSWLGRLRSGLTKTRQSLQDGIGQLITGKVALTEDTLEDIHELLFRSDVGVETADELVDHIRSSLKKADIKEPTSDDIRAALKQRVGEMLAAPIKGPVAKAKSGPTVFLVVGVNGVGKTTSIGKLGARFLSEDKTVMLAAADTFRAAAIDQLKVWGERIGARVIHHQHNSDPAAVVFDAVKAAKAADVDVLLIDTAGRLHNKKELMAELGKINKVIGKEIPDAPHETWLVVDATTGQNAHMQIKAFKEVVALSGLVVTKLDGTAKGGVVVGACHQFDLPVRYIGVGEQAADLREFSSEDFAEMML